jgi:histidinol-phosphatase (PHP family)
VIAGMKTGRYLYLAHPDLVNYVGADEIYEREIRRLCENLKEMEIPLEINLLGLGEKKHYPRARFWEIAGDVGNKVIVGIDAHWKEQIGQIEVYREAMEMVERYGLELVEEIVL